MKKLLTFIFLLFAVPVWAAVYHVATDGSGDFTTIAQVNAATFAAGDEILFKRGDVWAEDLTFPSCSGVSGNPISLGAYGSGNIPQVNRFIIDAYQHDIEVSNLYMTGTGILADACDVYGYNITFRDCTFDGDSQRCNAFVAKSHDVYVYNVNLYNCIAKNAGNYAGGGGEGGGGIIFSTGTRDCIVDTCIVFNNEEVGIQPFTEQAYFGTLDSYNFTIKNCTVYNDVSKLSDAETNRNWMGINIGWNVYNAVVERNYVYYCKGAGISCDGGAHNNTIKNNLLVNCGRTIWLIANAYGDCKNNLVYHNTLISNTVGIFGQMMEVYQTGAAVSSGNIIKNNITYITTAVTVLTVYAGVSTVTLDYNCVYNGSGANQGLWYKGSNYTTNGWNTYRTATSQDSNSIAADPLLTAAYHLKSGSPCINAGVDVGVDTDYDGNPRYQADMGSREFGVFLSEDTTELYNWTVN